MKDTIQEVRKKKWFRYYLFIAKIKIRIQVFLYKVKHMNKTTRPRKTEAQRKVAHKKKFGNTNVPTRRNKNRV